MPRKQPQLAKLSRPRLYKPVVRERLFRLLDEKREHPVVWIAGPPGSGKTTLVASYLEEAGVPSIWYQMDAGDADPATFFHFLRLAMESAGGRSNRKLPHFTPQYLKDIPGFARRFMRHAFAGLPQGVAIVFDNYQEIDEDSNLHRALSVALEELPPGSTSIIISRAQPPSRFAERRVNRTLSMLSWIDLQLTVEEVRLIAKSMGMDDADVARDVHKQTDGWMGGVTLMLESASRGTGIEMRRASNALGTVFDYFAGHVLDGATNQMRDVLLRTAFLPWITDSLARCLTDAEEAFSYLGTLHRRHLFTDRKSAAEPTYQYHALFSEFLRSRAREQFTAEECIGIIRRSAVLLLAQARHEEAFPLFVEAEDWDQCVEIVLDRAPPLVTQGRSQTVAAWIDALPQAIKTSNPWLQYWLGRSKIFLQPVSVRNILENAFDEFARIGETTGQLLCATTILEGFFLEFDNIRPMDRWVACLAELLGAGGITCSKEDELRAYSAVMMGAVVRAPKHSMLEICKQRVAQLLEEPFEPTVKVATASVLNAYSNIAMDDDAERLAIRIAHPLLKSGKVTGAPAGFYWNSEGYTHYLHGRYEKALECFDASDSTAEESRSSEGYWIAVGFRRGLCQRRAGLLDEAERTVRQIEGGSRPVVGHEAGGMNLLRAGIAFDRGQVGHAMTYVLDAYKAFDEAGHFNGVILTGLVAANMTIAGGRLEEASAILDRLANEEYGTIAQNYLGAVVLNQAWLEHRRGDHGACATSLKRALALCVDKASRVRMRWYGNAMSELLPIAFREGLEVEMATLLASEYTVLPSPPDVEQWPWPVKIRTFGTFDLLIHGRKPDYSRKVPKKILALLKVIVAYGGQEVTERRITDALWPDDDGDSARRSLTATLHRLRKLMGNIDSVVQSEGRLSLNPRYCWVDALVAGARNEESSAAASLDSLLSLYRGPFLDQEEEMPWVLPMREKLRSKFIHAVGKRGSSLEGEHRFEQAAELYHRGIEADPLVEPFYQGLMRCYKRLDRRAEGASAFRRLRQTLSVTLGVQPSESSQRLFESLQGR